MYKVITFVIVEIVQILLSINLVIRRKNKIAILTEIITSIFLCCMLNKFSLKINIDFWKYVLVALLGYLVVKIFLASFMLIMRLYCFYKVKKSCKRKKKINKKESKRINKFSKVVYWPKLKLGLPGRAGKTSPLTKVKFDEKGFPKFKAYYTVKLERKDYKKTREQHFYIANKMLYKKIVTSSKLRSKFSKQEIKEFSLGITPKRYTWHHHQNVGVLQLVEYDIHSKISHIGGYSIWGKQS